MPEEGLEPLHAALPAPEPSEQRAQHQAGLGRKRQVTRHADDDAKEESEHGPDSDCGSDAHRASLVAGAE
jgi:hypothetical protein